MIKSTASAEELPSRSVEKHHKRSRHDQRRLTVDVVDNRAALELTTLVWRSDDTDERTEGSTRSDSSQSEAASCPSSPIPTIDWNDQDLALQSSRESKDRRGDSNQLSKKARDLLFCSREERLIVDIDLTVKALQWMRQEKALDPELDVSVRRSSPLPVLQQSPCSVASEPTVDTTADLLAAASPKTRAYDFAANSPSSFAAKTSPLVASFRKSVSGPQSRSVTFSSSSLKNNPATKSPSPSTISSAKRNDDNVFDDFVIGRQHRQTSLARRIMRRRGKVVPQAPPPIVNYPQKTNAQGDMLDDSNEVSPCTPPRLSASMVSSGSYKTSRDEDFWPSAKNHDNDWTTPPLTPRGARAVAFSYFSSPESGSSEPKTPPALPTEKLQQERDHDSSHLPHACPPNTFDSGCSNVTPLMLYTSLNSCTTPSESCTASPPTISDLRFVKVEPTKIADDSAVDKPPKDKALSHSKDDSLMHFATSKFQSAVETSLSTQEGSLTPVTALLDSAESSPCKSREGTVQRDFTQETARLVEASPESTYTDPGVDDSVNSKNKYAERLGIVPPLNLLSLPTLEEEEASRSESKVEESDGVSSSDPSSNDGLEPFFDGVVLPATVSNSSWKTRQQEQRICADSFQRASSLLEAGMKNIESGKHEIAIQSFGNAASIFRRSPKKAVALARTLNLLGTAYTRACQWDEALPCLHESLLLRYKHLGKWHVDTVDTMNNIGNVYMRSGSFKYARRCYWQVFWARQAIFGTQHPSVAVSAHDLANAFQAAERYGKAHKFYGIAMQVYEELSVPKSNPAIRCLLRDIEMLRTSSGTDKRKPVEF